MTLPSAEFLSRLREAAMCEAWVAAKLAASGLYVLHHPITAAKSEDEVRMFGGQYDLTIYDKHPEHGSFWATGKDAEVKGNSRYYTDPATFRAGKDQLYLCSQSSWLKKNPCADKTSVDFFFVSHRTFAIIWVPVGTPVELGVDGYDPRRDEAYKVAAFDPACARTFQEFIDGFKKEK